MKVEDYHFSKKDFKKLTNEQKKNVERMKAKTQV